MPIEVICSIISVSGVLLSAVISSLAARHSAKNEMKRLKAEWAREDSSDEHKAFEKMLTITVEYLNDTLFDNSTETLSAIALARSSADSGLAPLLDDLYKTVMCGNRKGAAAALDRIIEYRRSSKTLKRSSK